VQRKLSPSDMRAQCAVILGAHRHLVCVTGFRGETMDNFNPSGAVGQESTDAGDVSNVGSLDEV